MPIPLAHPQVLRAIAEHAEAHGANSAIAVLENTSRSHGAPIAALSVEAILANYRASQRTERAMAPGLGLSAGPPVSKPR